MCETPIKVHSQEKRGLMAQRTSRALQIEGLGSEKTSQGKGIDKVWHVAGKGEGKGC